MPGILCSCGKALKYGVVPCPIEWLLISDTEADRYQGQIDAEDLYRAARSLLRCPDCDRLWVFWEGFQKAPTEYVPGRVA
jgi:hypothetical protein